MYIGVQRLVKILRKIARHWINNSVILIRLICKGRLSPLPAVGAQKRSYATACGEKYRLTAQIEIGQINGGPSSSSSSSNSSSDGSSSSSISNILATERR